MKIKALNGFKDILSAEVSIWSHVEETVRDILERFHFTEIRLPILEKTELFARSIGTETDIVEKEMYTFVDKQVTMRPEATASLIRAYIEHHMHTEKPVQRLFTIGPMFRHERPQRGRLRQFHQLDVEVLGSFSPRLDAELLAMGALLFRELDVSTRLEINSLGCPLCRPKYRKQLLDFIDTRFDHLCNDCKRRSRTNPLRVLDCKETDCRTQAQEAPSILDYLCEECAEHFAEVRNSLKLLDVDFTLNKCMVRGLDYYVRTTFEFVTNELGAQSAVCAGGRYDGLIEMLGGGKIPGIGFAIGMERLVLLLRQQQTHGVEKGIDLFLAGLGKDAARTCFKLMHQLRSEGISADMDLEGRSLKSQMKQADKAGSRYVLIVGDQELEKKAAVLRNMSTKKQQELPLTATAVLAGITNT
ncbi:MAG: histidine--tRNA ligase [Proteobacteria bacterium]|nr:MAG: histidine--tRNA ligase [Pseudomonadota bacterium]PIE64577.1 MAG: histidine--tRNA ligase [Desulfobacterales bacterium]